MQEKNEKSLDKHRTEKMSYYREVIIGHVNEYYDGNLSGFSRAVGISYSTLMRYLSQNSLPSKQNIKKLSHAIPALKNVLDMKRSSSVSSPEIPNDSEYAEEMMQAFIDLARSTLEIMKESIKSQNEQIRALNERITNLEKTMPQIYETLIEIKGDTKKR